MSLLVHNVVSSSSQISYSYLAGDELFGYLITLNYTLKTEDIQFDNDDGVLLSGRAAIRAAYKKQNITARIAGDEIHNGLITSISFSEGSLTAEDTVTITIEERRRLSDYSSKTFSKYLPNPHLLADFTESYDFSRSGVEYSYTRSISIQYAQEVGDSFLHNAKAFLTNYYLANRPQIGYYEDGISENARFDNRYNGTLNETIDLVNLSVSLEESFSSSFIESSENVSKDIKSEYEIDDQGYLKKVVSINLKALRNDSENVLSAAIAATIDDITSNEESQFGKPFLIEKGISKGSNSATLSLSFSTNPKFSQENVVTYNCVKTKNGGFISYDLSVEYRAKGKNVRQRYDNLIALWNSAKSNNLSKVTGLFSEAVGVIYEQSRNASISKAEGKVTESIKYTTDNTYDSSGLPDGIIKYNISVSKNEKVKRSQVFLDVVNLKQKLVALDLDKLGSATVTATVTSDNTYGNFHAKDFLLSKTSELDAALEEDTYYGTSDQITIDIGAGTTTRVINYIIA